MGRRKALLPRFSCLIWQLILLCILPACQWMKDKPATARSMMGQSSCKVLGSELRQFLEKDISNSLDCLRQQLKLYAMVDQRENINEINKTELQNFLGKFLFKGDDQKDGITTLFAIHQHIFAGAENSIPVEAIDPIFKLLIQVNKFVVPIYQYYQVREHKNNLTIGEYEYLKAQSDQAFSGLTETITKEIVPHNGQFHQLSTATILDLVGFENNPQLVNDSTNLRYLKRLFLGGDQESFTFPEIKLALEKLPELGPTLLDLFMFESIIFDTELQKLRFIEKTISSIKKLIFVPESEKQIYFNIDDLIIIAKSLNKLPIDISKYKNSLIEIKQSSIIGGDENFTYDNIQKIFKHIDHILGINIAFTELWYLNEDTLLAPTEVKKEQLIIPDSNDRQIEMFKQLFLHVATTYKYLPKHEALSIYGSQYVRSLSGMIEVGAYEYLVKEFVKAYGSLEGGKAMTKDNFLNVVMSYQDFVVDLNFWRNPITKMVNSQFLMADFFRHHSNGNGMANISEIVGIILMDGGSYHLAKKTYPSLQEKSQNEGFELISFDDIDPNPPRENPKLKDSPIVKRPNFNGVATEFFYKNFFNWVSSFRDTFPLLYKDLLTLSKIDREKYARSMSMFTRHCPFDYLDEKEVPILQKDLVLILGGMISVEETFIRFDVNQNQSLDYDELENIVVHFRPAILEVMQASGFVAKDEDQAANYSRTIFYHLIINQSLPLNEKGKVKKIEFLKFHANLHLFLKENKIKANRTLLAQVLLSLSPREATPRPDCFREKVLPE